ncbi:enoyl-CoA hydratase [Bisporella sp. PMI_857]|nr:enoyl-CoA hydratase [Bisporella sp. PMI_857]
MLELIEMVGYLLVPAEEVLHPLQYWLLSIAACTGLFLLWLGRFEPPENSSKSVLEDWRMITTVEGFEVSQLDKSVKICLSNPDRGNPLNTLAIQNITLLFRKFSADNSIRRILLTGQGQFFCTGMDLHENLDQLSAQKRLALQELFHTIELCPHTTIAAINGSAYGGGVGLAFACDIRIAIESSFFCLSEVKLGLCPAMISKILVREWGTSLSRMAMLTGNRIRSRRLYEVGAVHYLARDLGELNSISDRLLRRLQYTAPQASTWIKSLVREITNVGPNMDSYCGKIFESMLARDQLVCVP